MRPGTVSRLAAPAALAALLAGAAARQSAPTAEQAAERPWAVQLHLHGPASEGQGSVDSHSREAELVGADVLWWSEHDWRAASYRHVTRYGFEGQEALDRGEAWTARWASEIDPAGSEPGGLEPAGPEPGRRRSGRNEKRIDAARWTAFDRERLIEGQASLRIESTTSGQLETEQGPGGRSWRLYLREVRAGRGRLKRPLGSGVRLELAVWPEELSDEVRPEVRVELSEHPPRAADGAPIGDADDFEVWELHYRLVSADSPERARPQRDGALLVVPVPARAGEWNHLVLEVSADAQAGFGELGLDNSFASLQLGLAVAGEHEPVAAVNFDALAIEQELQGQAAIERQAELVEVVAARYPALRQLSGLELSYLEPHLNVYGTGPSSALLPDYDALLAGLEADLVVDAEVEARLGAELALRAVAEAHAQGGLVSFNHLFGTDMERDRQDVLTVERRPREELLAELAGHRLYGADLLEVGYRDRGGHDLADHLWVWDRLAEADLFPVGTGVSDSHGGPEQRWTGGGNDLVSWVLAPTPSAADLVAGLAAGRVAFGDLEHFDGRLDLESERGFRMGQVLVTDRAWVRVRAVVEGAGELVPHWVGDFLEGGEAPAGEQRSGAEQGRALELPPLTVPLQGRERARVRLELRTDRGAAQAFSNPLQLLRAVPAAGLSAARAGLDLDGVRSRALAGLTLVGATAGQGGLALELDAAGAGLAILELDDPARAAGARLEQPLSGTLERDGARLVLRELSGRGRVLIPSRP